MLRLLGKKKKEEASEVEEQEVVNFEKEQNNHVPPAFDMASLPTFEAAFASADTPKAEQEDDNASSEVMFFCNFTSDSNDDETYLIGQHHTSDYYYNGGDQQHYGTTAKSGSSVARSLLRSGMKLKRVFKGKKTYPKEHRQRFQLQNLQKKFQDWTIQLPTISPRNKQRDGVGVNGSHSYTEATEDCNQEDEWMEFATEEEAPSAKPTFDVEDDDSDDDHHWTPTFPSFESRNDDDQPNFGSPPSASYASFGTAAAEETEGTTVQEQWMEFTATTTVAKTKPPAFGELVSL